MTLVIAGAIPTEWNFYIDYYSNSLDSGIAAYAQWSDSDNEHDAFGLIKVRDNTLIMEIYFKGLPSSSTDYRVEETFVRVPEEETPENE